ncbi:MAG TPA: metal-dependent transcriptional regulator [Spirochaetota bacterium]|nr:metal-dependent transcriptional regulator [Spirochaetota bacterium]HPJ33604.1 metal-dependent transcriptional regulator [Spirochaetota bacterium]
MLDIYSIDIDELYGDTELSPHMEDYIETIAVLSQNNRVVRVRDIAAELKIKMPSVTSALNKLKELGLIEYEKYGYIELTKTGSIVSERVLSRHICLADFFSNVLKLPKEKAEAEACKIEHHITPELCKRIHKFLIYFHEENASGKYWTKDIDSLLK